MASPPGAARAKDRGAARAKDRGAARAKGGHPSTVRRLPPEVRELIAGLRDQGRTLDEILDKLRELQVDVSRSALGRYTKQLDAVGSELRRSREVAQALVRELGDEPESRAARLNIELMHSITLKLLVNEDGQVASLDPEELMFLGQTLHRLAAANKLDTERTLQIQKEALTKAAAVVEKTARKAGLTAETVQNIKAQILGLKL
jgi:hypothetical protein